MCAAHRQISPGSESAADIVNGPVHSAWKEEAPAENKAKRTGTFFSFLYFSPGYKRLGSRVLCGMPRELTQNRIQKIWIPTKDDKPAPRRGETSIAFLKMTTEEWQSRYLV